MTANDPQGAYANDLSHNCYKTFCAIYDYLNWGMSGSHLIGQNLAHIETESAHMLTIHAQIGNIMSAKNAQQIFRKLIFLAPPLGWLLLSSATCPHMEEMAAYLAALKKRACNQLRLARDPTHSFLSSVWTYSVKEGRL